MLSKIRAMLSRFFTIGIEPFCPMYSTTFSLPKIEKFTLYLFISASAKPGNAETR